ncbi:YdbC family protein [Bacillus cereus]|uniref:YdbC family protein n=1 Tax=Bacillus TaxID=1386 RepID=UPI00054EF7F2|nr:YdbC family protein [Bacillus sp. UNC322MFChir4.1]
MLIKSIICKVSDEKKELFSAAQEQWGELNALDGFYGQIGGWDESEACIVSLWENMKMYQSFMNESHDKIFNDNNQESTYTSCETELYQSLFDMSETPFVEALAHSSFLRIAICDVKQESEKQFLHMQETVWNPGMERAEGMMGGVVGRSLSSNRYIVLSLWKDEAAHRHYVKEIFPQLLHTANLSQQVLHIEGKQTTLVNSWAVLPVHCK